RKKALREAAIEINGPHQIATLIHSLAFDHPLPFSTSSSSSSLTPDEAFTVIDNLTLLFSSLPPKSPVKRELAARITNNLPKHKAATLANYKSTRSIDRGRKEVNEAGSGDGGDSGDGDGEDG